MSKRAEQAVERIHNRALIEAEKYATSHGRSIIEEVAFGRGFKAGFIECYDQAEKDTIAEVEKWLRANFHHRNCWNEDEFCISLRDYFGIKK